MIKIAYVVLFIVNVNGGEPVKVDVWTTQNYRPDPMKNCKQSAASLNDQTNEVHAYCIEITE